MKALLLSCLFLCSCTSLDLVDQWGQPVSGSQCVDEAGWFSHRIAKPISSEITWEWIVLSNAEMAAYELKNGFTPNSSLAITETSSIGAYILSAKTYSTLTAEQASRVRIKKDNCRTVFEHERDHANGLTHDGCNSNKGECTEAHAEQISKDHGWAAVRPRSNTERTK